MKIGRECYETRTLTKRAAIVGALVLVMFAGMAVSPVAAQDGGEETDGKTEVIFEEEFDYSSVESSPWECYNRPYNYRNVRYDRTSTKGFCSMGGSTAKVQEESARMRYLSRTVSLPETDGNLVLEARARGRISARWSHSKLGIVRDSDVRYLENEGSDKKQIEIISSNDDYPGVTVTDWKTVTADITEFAGDEVRLAMYANGRWVFDSQETTSWVEVDHIRIKETRERGRERRMEKKRPETTEIIDDFERASPLTEYDFQRRDSWSVTGDSLEGDVSLNTDDHHGTDRLISYEGSGLNYYPKVGDKFSFVYKSIDGDNTGAFLFGAPDGSTSDYYRAAIKVRDVRPGSPGQGLRLSEVEDGDFVSGVKSNFGETSLKANQAYEAEVSWFEDKLVARLYEWDEQENERASSMLLDEPLTLEITGQFNDNRGVGWSSTSTYPGDSTNHRFDLAREIEGEEYVRRMEDKETVISRTSDGELYQTGKVTEVAGKVETGGNISVTGEMQAEAPEASDDIVYSSVGLSNGTVLDVEQMDGLGSGTVTHSLNIPERPDRDVVWSFHSATTEEEAIDKFESDAQDGFVDDQGRNLGIVIVEGEEYVSRISGGELYQTGKVTEVEGTVEAGGNISVTAEIKGKAPEASDDTVYGSIGLSDGTVLDVEQMEGSGNGTVTHTLRIPETAQGDVVWSFHSTTTEEGAIERFESDAQDGFVDDQGRDLGIVVGTVSGEDEERVPGFTVVAALIALVSAAAVLLRRRE